MFRDENYKEQMKALERGKEIIEAIDSYHSVSHNARDSRNSWTSPASVIIRINLLLHRDLEENAKYSSTLCCMVLIWIGCCPTMSHRLKWLLIEVFLVLHSRGFGMKVCVARFSLSD